MLAPNMILQNRYLIKRQIGRGGMGAVYEALDQRFDAVVAVKETLQNDGQFRKFFEREARLLYGLRHPMLPRVIDHFTEADSQFLVMDYVPGEDLETLRQRAGGRFPVADVVKWTLDLLDVLVYLHGLDPPIIHRDIKPQNLKLTPTGELMLLDFGLAKGVKSHIKTSTTSNLLGYTPNYAPLEQIRGTATDARSDLYSLSATVYTLLTGMNPPDVITRMAEIHNGAPDPLRRASELNPQVPIALAEVLTVGLSIIREQRPVHASSMRQLIENAVPKASRASTTGRAAEHGSPPPGPIHPVARPPVTPAHEEATRLMGRSPGIGHATPDAPRPSNAAGTSAPGSTAAAKLSPHNASEGASEKAAGAIFHQAAPESATGSAAKSPATGPRTGTTVRPPMAPPMVARRRQGRRAFYVILLGLFLIAGTIYYVLQSVDRPTGHQEAEPGNDQSTYFHTMTPAQHLAAALRLVKPEASKADLNQARNHLISIPTSSREYQEARNLLEQVERLLREGNTPARKPSRAER